IKALIQRRSAKPRARSGPERQSWRRLIPHRQFTGDFAAEIAVVLVTRGDVGEHAWNEVRLQIGVGTDVVTLGIRRILRPKSRKYLRSRRCDAAILRRIETVDVRSCLPGADYV